MEASVESRPVHRWYTRPVFFVGDMNRALGFYVDKLGFAKKWHEGDGAGGVCQVNRGECEVILCEDARRRGLGRLYVELTSGVLEEIRRELADRGVSVQEIWWGNNALQIVDPDGNELLFPISEGAAPTGTAG